MFINTFQIDISLCETLQITDHWDNRSLLRDPFNRFYYITEGSAELIINNQRLLLKTGYCYILPAGVPLQLLPVTSKFHQVYAHFNATLQSGIELFSFINAPYELPADYINETLNNSWETLFFQTFPKNSYNALKQDAALRMLLAPFIAKGIECSLKKESRLDRFDPVISYINKHYTESITTQTLASLVSLQPTYFSNTFSKLFGISPQQYICQVRVNKAQEMLENSTMLIKEISSSVGYDDELYFSRLFKKYVGVSPLKYRKQRQEKPY